MHSSTKSIPNLKWKTRAGRILSDTTSPYLKNLRKCQGKAASFRSGQSGDQQDSKDEDTAADNISQEKEASSTAEIDDKALLEGPLPNTQIEWNNIEDVISEVKEHHSTPGMKKSLAPLNVGGGEKVDSGSNLKKITWGQLQPAKEQDESEAKVCPWCSIVMNSRSKWTVHRKFNHHYGVFQCPVCQFQCNFAKEIHEHMKTEAHIGKVYCQNCQQHFTSGEMESHYVMCATGCAICKKTYSNPIRLRDHRKYAHQEERGVSEDKFSCERCGKQYLTPKLLRSHIFKFHEDGVKIKKPRLCSICGMSFKNYSLMYCHRVKVHKEFEKQCQKCGLKFANTTLLKLHLQSHEAPQFKCSFCGKMLKTKINLESHEMAHRGEKPFQCSLCSASFTKKDRLDQHLKGAHKIAGPRGGKVGWAHGNKKKQGDR